jgi:hypothetical protein
LLSEGKPEQKRDFLKKIGSNFQVAEKSLSVKLLNPWQFVADFNSDLATPSRLSAKPLKKKTGGEGGIRTPGTLASTQHFQCCTFGHSVTSPRQTGK